MALDEVVKLTHGAGGSLMEELIKEVIVSGIDFRRALDGVGLDEMDDGASLKLGEHELVVSMDGHTVDPIFFPGGDIGRLAVSGTTNDVAMMGARPVALSDAIVVEEGFPTADLRRIIDSMNTAAKEIDVAVVGGDFKVMPRGKLDQIVISTCCVGVTRRGRVILDSGARPGDKVVFTGSIGDHGIALLAVREGLGFETRLESDIAPIWKTVEAALKVGGLTAMKDPTRGGVAGVLNDIAAKSNVSIWLDEADIPIKESVRAASEMLGLDPLEVTCEGRAVITIHPEKAEEALKSVRRTKYGRGARVVGEVRAERPGWVMLKTEVGGTRVLDKPLGEPIPRVC
jgi:hydrogenase expression/formation protein HypE